MAGNMKSPPARGARFSLYCDCGEAPPPGTEGAGGPSGTPPPPGPTPRVRPGGDLTCPGRKSPRFQDLTEFKRPLGLRALGTGDGAVHSNGRHPNASTFSSEEAPIGKPTCRFTGGWSHRKLRVEYEIHGSPWFSVRLEGISLMRDHTTRWTPIVRACIEGMSGHPADIEGASINHKAYPRGVEGAL